MATLCVPRSGPGPRACGEQRLQLFLSIRSVPGISPVLGKDGWCLGQCVKMAHAPTGPGALQETRAHGVAGVVMESRLEVLLQRFDAEGGRR